MLPRLSGAHGLSRFLIEQVAEYTYLKNKMLKNKADVAYVDGCWQSTQVN